MSNFGRNLALWVIIALLLVVLFVILHLSGNGFGEHMHMEREGYTL